MRSRRRPEPSLRASRGRGAHARPRQRMHVAIAALGLALGAVSPVHAQTSRRIEPGARETPDQLDARWHASFDAFAELDRAHAPAPGGIVFVGSSSIRLWSGLEHAFGVEGVVKRGFGGSRMSDCARYADRLVLAYQPRLVVVYAGDNDLAEGRSPQDVLASYRRFVERVHAALPQTRIAYVSIKPSPSREALMPAVIEANERIARYSGEDPRLDFIDVYAKMVDARGRPRAELFLPDSLHLSPAGYAVWRESIAAHLR